MKPSLLVPEVVQTSGMDCGPACLTALVRGFGLDASYGRLREMCQTSLDGTSIDTIEEVVIRLGLDAEQVIIPPEHLLSPPTVTPGIVVARQPAGAPHFIVLWKRQLGRAQIMDPAKGRRWVHPDELARELYEHEMELPADAWRDWAGEPLFVKPLELRLRGLGARDPAAYVARALEDPTWKGIATLDAATRAVETVIRGGGVRSGREAVKVLDGLIATPTAIAARFWFARTGSTDDDITVRGCVQLRVTGARAGADATSAAPLENQREPNAWRAVMETMFAQRRASAVAIAVVAVLAGIGIVFETALYRVMFEAGSELATRPQLIGALAVLLVFITSLWLLELATFRKGLDIGRTTEVKMRVQLAEKLPRLGIHYLKTRPIADTAERGHSLHRLRDLPVLGLRLIRSSTELIATTVALIWLAPSAWPLVIGLVLSAFVPPLVALRALSERELRMRTHAAAMSWFALDALQGAIPARASGLEPTLRREHDGLLVEWASSALAEHRLSTGIAWVQGLVGYGFVILIVFARVAAGGTPASLLLLVYWALAIPAAGSALATAMREVPMHRNATLRLLEPITAPDSESQHAGSLPRATSGVAIDLAGLSVVLRGQTILDHLDVAIAPGEHVAIVGLSGGGKSTLLGLFLGLSTPTSGELRIDGELLDADRLVALRAQTAWIDPGVTLWNDSLANNLRFSVASTELADVADLASRAELTMLLARLPEGFATRLGENGGLVSGGEGQRVRLGRGLARRDARLIIMDEPFRGLDREARDRHLRLVREYWRGSTLLCATHDLAETKTFPRVLVVERGVVLEDGDPATLAADPSSRYSQLLDHERSAQSAWSRWKRLVIVDGELEERA